MAIIQKSFLDLTNTSALSPKFTLNGLLEAKIGIIAAAPDVGKSHFCISLAIEHATSLKTFGLSATNKPKKTLIVSTEDPESILSERLTKKKSFLSEKVLNELNENLFFIGSSSNLDPIVNNNASQRKEHEAYLSELVGVFSQFSLIIIDTLTESLGCCDEVRDDRLIKETYSYLAKESGASILLVHHVGKEEIRGKQAISIASPTGLSSLTRLTKFVIALSHEDDIKVKKKKRLTCTFIKSNYIELEQQRKPFQISNKNESGLMCSVDLINEVLASKKLSSKLKTVKSRPSIIAQKSVKEASNTGKVLVRRKQVKPKEIRIVGSDSNPNMQKINQEIDLRHVI